jgi:hypothetical protein
MLRHRVVPLARQAQAAVSKADTAAIDRAAILTPMSNGRTPQHDRTHNHPFGSLARLSSERRRLKTAMSLARHLQP